MMAATAAAPGDDRLVQSLPVGDFDIALAPGAQPTWQALGELVNGSNSSLDFTAMYIDLLGTADRKIYSASQMRAFGADRGQELFAALMAAAVRGIAVRVLLGTLDNPLDSTEVRCAPRLA